MNSILSRKIYITIGLIFIFSISLSTTDLKSQPISTVSEIYDYDIGDVFHYHISITDGIGGGWNIYRNIEIIDKYFLQNNTKLCYKKDVAETEKYSGNSYWTYSYYVDSVCYSNLDSLICDTAITYIDTSLYNSRLINKVYYSDHGYEANLTYHWVVGCGQAYHKWYNWSGTYYKEQIIHYQKGSEIWGNAIYVDLPEIRKDNILVYPNPAIDYINIKCAKCENEYAEIYSIVGSLVKKINLVDESTKINVSDLKKGMYILVISRGENRIIKKLIKE